ncbi:hypothetical protein, conserved [Trypanosoma brucei brucei TREU927]|uniref:Chromatin assembly factor 1 subunit A dimerization domain-containing protein n=1 Tax=Trypanosoma brucei brucei (strain 927/4 GUTat10.1) TaxID=185431 RepID=Q581B8_TRYB2|nr:hypothetical protein, conserved [Trypanosoma brucei brucei TREU927]AAX78935.1 hypothetical protein, conserved [Trypanosoma brucei]AAZ13163.1 hypothetical protein, conserved [Trypanosoma brucei brucei TREU927]
MDSVAEPLNAPEQGQSEEMKKHPQKVSAPCTAKRKGQKPKTEDNGELQSAGKQKRKKSPAKPPNKVRGGVKTRGMARAESVSKPQPSPEVVNEAPTSEKCNGTGLPSSDDDSEDALVFPSGAPQMKREAAQFNPGLALVRSVIAKIEPPDEITPRITTKRPRSMASGAADKNKKVAVEPPTKVAENSTPTDPVVLSPPSRGLASFGFYTQSKKSTESKASVNKLFTPFVQDKRVSPLSLQFWLPDGPALKRETHVDDVLFLGETSPKSLQSEVCATNNGKVVWAGEEDETHSTQMYQGVGTPYSSFAAMIEHATAHSDTNDGCSAYVTEALRRCPCSFHVQLPPPRKDFCNEIIFCGFYAISFDPCESRPPYFGTYNSQNALNVEELMRLARFGVSEEMPQMSNLDYEYDSGDDWDVADGDEDVGMSGDSNSDEEVDENSSSIVGSDEANNDFINDNDEYDDDSEAEIQRRMFDSRERRRNRLKGREKFVPAFSGPFVAVSALDHPLRDYDKFERISSELNDEVFTTMFEQCLRSCGNVGSSLTTNGNSNCTDVGENQQSFLPHSQQDKRDMTRQEVDILHGIVAANSRISTAKIVTVLLEGGYCVGVSQAEMVRTIRRHYERNHGILVRRVEPWAATDERLFKRRKKQKAGASTANDGDRKEGNDDDDDVQEMSGDDDDMGEEVPLAVTAMEVVCASRDCRSKR